MKTMWSEWLKRAKCCSAESCDAGSLDCWSEFIPEVTLFVESKLLPSFSLTLMCCGIPISKSAQSADVIENIWLSAADAEQLFGHNWSGCGRQWSSKLRPAESSVRCLVVKGKLVPLIYSIGLHLQAKVSLGGLFLVSFMKEMFFSKSVV